MRVAFEPWAMGDAIIAASIASEAAQSISLACDPRWHPILRAALPPAELPPLVSLSLGYTTRHRESAMARGQAVSGIDQMEVGEVNSIRGDIRDYWAARQLFPNADLRFNGWVAFAAWHWAIADLPFSTGLFSVRNRYRAWAKLLRIPWKRVETRYQSRLRRGDGPVVIHVGAQWRSKQYPHVDALTRRLEGAGHRVQILAGPGDPLPAGIEETRVARAINEDLCQRLRECSQVMVNDSGPMHLAALLGRPTLAPARTTDLAEWIPPTVQKIVAASAPRGFRPDPRYRSDQVLDGWPDPEAVAKAMTAPQ